MRAQKKFQYLNISKLILKEVNSTKKQYCIFIFRKDISL